MILDSHFPPDYRVEKEAISLIEAGFEVFLFCVRYDDSPAREDYKGIKVCRWRSNVIEYKLSALAYTVPFYRMAMVPKISRFVRENKIDVLHIHDMVIAEAAFFVASKYRCQTVLDLHENRPEIMKEYRHLKKFPGNLLIDLEVWRKKQIDFVKLADKVVVVTDLARKDLARDASRNPEEIAVVPNTPAIEFLSRPLNVDVIKRMENGFNLLYVGDTSERRGTALLLKVLQRLENKIPNVELWIVGRSSFDEDLRQLADSLTITPRVHFEGWQHESLFPSYIEGSHICLSPLNRNVHHDTTYANKVFQYMARGRVCVVSDCTAQAELVQNEDCGVVFPAGSIDQCAKVILDLFNEPARRQQLGENGKRAVIERWNWESTSASLIDIHLALNTR